MDVGGNGRRIAAFSVALMLLLARGFPGSPASVVAAANTNPAVVAIGVRQQRMGFSQVRVFSGERNGRIADTTGSNGFHRRRRRIIRRGIVVAAAFAARIIAVAVTVRRSRIKQGNDLTFTADLSKRRRTGRVLSSREIRHIVASQADKMRGFKKSSVALFACCCCQELENFYNYTLIRAHSFLERLLSHQDRPR